MSVLDPFSESRPQIITGASEQPQAGEVSILDIMAVIRQQWLLVLLTAIIGTLGAATIALSLKPVFRAEVLLAPVKDSSANAGLSALAGQFGGLATLAGVNLSGGSSHGETLATLNSRALAENYILTHQLLPVLFAAEWNAGSKQWRNPQTPPTLWQGYEKFNDDIRRVVDDKKNGLTTLSIEWTDPALTAQWANELVVLANSMLRQRAIDASKRNLSYLNAELEKTTVVELRQAIYRLIEAEIKNVMVAQGSEEYAFKVIDPAVVPERKVKPKRTLIVIFGLILGLMLGVFFAFLRSIKRDTK